MPAHRRVRRYIRHGMLPQLAVFEAIARLGNYTRAGEELHLAQSTVSTQMRKLTEVVGLPLVEQTGKTIRLTEAGRRLQRSCAALFECLEQTETALAELRTLDSGRLALAVSTTGAYFAPRLLAAFSARYPGIEISVAVHGRSELVRRLQRNDDDLYIFANPPEEGVVTQKILPNPMVVLARADHPLVGVARVPLARLAEESFVAREPGSGTRRFVEEAFARHGLKPRVRIEAASNEAVKQAILAGAGISVLSRYTLAADVESGRLAMLDVEGFPLVDWWHFAYPVGKQVSAAARAFMDFVRAQAPQLLEEETGALA